MQGPRTLWDHEVQERPLSDVHRWVSQGMFFCSSIWQGPHERRSAIKPLTARNIDLTNDGSDWGPDSRGSWGLRTRVFFIKFLLQRSPNPQVWWAVLPIPCCGVWHPSMPCSPAFESDMLLPLGEVLSDPTLALW